MQLRALFRLARTSLTGVAAAAVLLAGAGLSAAPATAAPREAGTAARVVQTPVETDVTPENWEQIVRYSFEKPVVLDFGSEMCTGCEKLAEDLHNLVQRADGAWMVGGVDRAVFPELHARFDVTTLPTLVVLRNGKDQSGVVPRFVGYNDTSADWVKLWYWTQDVRNGDYPPVNPPDPGIEVTVTTENIDEVVRKSHEKPVILQFGAPWCSACKELRPHMQQFARDDDGAWLLGQVNGDAHPALNKRFLIKGYPTLIALVDGKEIARRLAYNGQPRTYRDWVDSVLAAG